ncbi:methyltransferase type 12 [Burkholderia sp. AU42008]|uniref:terpene synthase family protein n=1 Tax=unclassified Burkholderia TaxID=2613784 RepID=UPI000B7A5F4B|nr:MULTISPECIES: methyltransferase type 12 [unclassified Burkholderia]MBY4871586.1 methyltransferase type 12 [Burkholderia sp. AU42008]OXI37698.1 methyltransferase type 12 [Burkholderia sp. AU17457]
MQASGTPHAASAAPSATQTLVLPLPRLSLPVARHPQYEAIEQQLAIDDYPYILRHYRSDAAARRFLAQRIPAYGSLCYPNARPDRAYTIHRMMNVTTLMDDAFTHLARTGDQAGLDALRDHFLAAVDGTPPPANVPAARLLHDTLRAMHARCDARPAFWQRFVECVRAQIRTQADPTATDASRLSLADYLAFRRVEGFGHWITLLTEYALDVDMGQRLAQHAALADARDRTIDSVILVNDLFSFRKERSAHERFNAVWILMRVEQLNVQAALDRLAALCTSNERRLIDAREAVATGVLADDPDTQAYVTELGYMSAGNAEFHAFSTRYHGDDLGGGRFAGGEIAMTALPTLEEIAAADRQASHR